VVSSAIIYDFRPRDNVVYPDKELGRRAFLGASHGSCPVGQRGAGRLATVGKIYQVPSVQYEPGGQGAAFGLVGDTGVRVLVVTVVNAIGVIVDRSGRVVRGCWDAERRERRHPREILAPGAAKAPAAVEGAPTQNTTVTAVITNKRMSQTTLTKRRAGSMPLGARHSAFSYRPGWRRSLRAVDGDGGRVGGG
jgi:L-aminopeptidase/D-esterase-like protein